MYKDNIKEFFDNNYKKQEHYWWKNDNRFSVSEEDHTPYYATIIIEAKKLKTGCVLDLGAGEGADSIRLAKLGFDVDAVEMSSIGAEKIRKQASESGCRINVFCEDVERFIPQKQYEIVMCNGVLHYIENKERVVELMQNCTKTGGINSISLFSNYSEIPKCHQVVPVFPDCEGGLIEQMYKNWESVFQRYEHEKPESSHDDMEPHVHSYIKRIWRKIA